MQVRFTKYENGKFKLLGYCNIENYSEAYKMFEYMKNNRCQYCVQHNIEDVADIEGEYYDITDVSFVFPGIGCELLPYISVVVTEE